MTQYRVIVNGNEYFPRLIERSHSSVRFELNGTVHEVSVAPTLRSAAPSTRFPANQVGAIAPQPARASSSVAANSKELRAPMPGVVVSIPIKEGDSVAQGETLLVVEAMKMENNIPAPRDGTVKKIHVQSGQELEPNALLVSFG
ncbi:MAG: hypothetical protein KDD64_05955 [Bdellovibrionales bacterium]|nr:hypothetical protein [Bdellovibrionales bacterium]